VKVLLIKDVKSLGKAGEIKDVKDGYGKNFLIGKGYAKAATADVLSNYAATKKAEAKAEAEEIAKLNELKDQLEALEVKISKKLGNTGHLFGAVTKDEIAKVFQSEHDIEIDKRSIEIKNVIKISGKHEIGIKLGHGIHAQLHVEVVGE